MSRRALLYCVFSGVCLKIHVLSSKPVNEDVEVSVMALLHLQRREAENISVLSVSVWEHRVMDSTSFFVWDPGSSSCPSYSATANSK